MFVLIISGSSSIMGGMGSKSRSIGQILVKSCLHCSGHIFAPIFLGLALNVCLMISQSSAIMGGIESKSRSLGQILEKSYLPSKVHNIDAILFKCSECLAQ